QGAEAFLAASIAARASSLPLDGYSATIARASAGLALRQVLPDFAATHSPPIKLWCVRIRHFSFTTRAKGGTELNPPLPRAFHGLRQSDGVVVLNWARIGSEGWRVFQDG